MATSPGVYAVLLGSGVSRSAGIPTGWEITLELAARVARLNSEDVGGSIEAWYETKYGQPPSYSELVELIAPKSDERRALLNRFFEPTAEEREQGIKVPSPAHQAIARLVASGHIRVIVTTNFDRLMERALEEVGVAPIVIKSADDIAGAVPLPHAKCIILKIHGDYLDVRLRNTTQELEKYDKKIDTYLSRIFEDFGLIVCGWSGDWDTALRQSVTKSAGRRYGVFWCSRGEPSASAAKALNPCGAKRIGIESADSFFQDLADRVEALEDFGTREAMSVEQTISLIKLYSSEMKYRIRLTDLLAAEVDTAAAALQAADLSQYSGAENFRRLVSEVDAATSKLRAALAVGIATDQNPVATPYVRPLTLLHDKMKRVVSGTRQPLYPMQWLPLSELFYTIGPIALWRGSFETIRQLFELQFPGEYNDESRALDLLPATSVGGLDKRHWQQLEGRDRHYLPLNEHLAQLIEPDAIRAGLTSDEWETSFSRFEVLITVAYGQNRTSGFWGPPGRYAYRTPYGRDGDAVNWLAQEAFGTPANPLTAAGMFGGDVSNFKDALTRFNEWLPKLRQAFW